MSREASGLTEDRKKVFKRAFLMASGTLTSRILGLLRDVAMGALFDRTITDAWAAAFRVPNLFRRLLGEGSLSVSFIPVFLEAQEEDPHGVRSRNLVNGFYTLLLIAFGVLAVLGCLFTEEILRLLLSDAYSAGSEKWELTVRLGRIMFSFVFFICTYAYFMGILNALGVFGLPAVAPALLNISMLVFTFLPPQWFSGRGDGLAWGVLCGGILQATLLWGALRAKNYLPRLQKRIFSDDVKLVLKNMLPGLIGMGLMQFSTFVNLYYASSLAEGAISYIYWADRLLELPLSLISVSLGAALLPTLSSFAAKGDEVRFRETSQESFLMNFFLAWPAALGLFFLAEPIIEVLFLRGRFTSQDVLATAQVLRVYALSLLVISCGRVLLPLYYAMKNTWFPALVSCLCLAVHIFAAPYLMRAQSLRGLMVAGLLAAGLNFLILFMGLKYWKMAFSYRKLLHSLARFMVAGGALAAVVQVYFVIVEYLGSFWRMPVLAGIIALAGVTYFSMARWLGCEEVEKLRGKAGAL